MKEGIGVDGKTVFKTVSVREEFYEWLRLKAFNERKSMCDVLEEMKAKEEKPTA